MTTAPTVISVPPAVPTVKRPAPSGRTRRHLFAEMKLGLEGMDLLHQSIHEFLRSTDRQRRNVVDRLVGIQLGALSAHDLE